MGSKELFPITRIRNVVLFALVIFIVVTGFATITFTTSIEKHPLPLQHIANASTVVSQGVKYQVPVYVDVPNSQEHVVEALESKFNNGLSLLPRIASQWLIKCIRGPANPATDYVIELQPGKDAGYHISPFSKKITLYVNEAVRQGENVVELGTSVLHQVFDYEVAKFAGNIKSSAIEVPYSSRYNVVFSLFSELGHPVQWKIDEALKLFDPIFDSLKEYANFSVSLQIQYYSNLAEGVQFNQEIDRQVLRLEHLSTFINHGDWNLFSHDINPTINFMMYIPEKNYEDVPTVIENSALNSFLVPQWGGVHVLSRPMAKAKDERETVLSEDELLPVMEIFASQFTQLIGMGNQPKLLAMRTLLLYRTQLNDNLQQALDILNSLVKVVISLEGIAIPEATVELVRKLLSSVAELLTLISAGEFEGGMKESAKAVDYANRAFFEKEMVQQAYFPSEHKMAVYLPLLGPVGLICIFALLRVAVDAKRRMKQKKTQ